MTTAFRENGHVPIRDYAVIGDGRSAALVARDGSIDWLCLPDLDSESVFGAVLDAGHGGAFRLAPAEPFRVERRYVPDTNVLETTFTTAEGSVRVTDAMLLPSSGLSPARELVRRIEGLTGEVRMVWAVEPRFGHGRHPTRFGLRGGIPVASAGSDAIAVIAFGCGEARRRGEAIEGEGAVEAGAVAQLVLSVAHGDPLVFPSRAEVERRLGETIDFWRGWARGRVYEGRWRDAVVRSSLALRLLIHAPSGAIAAAATTSLPEELGGVRNWDYRYCWIRDSSATLDAFLGLGCAEEAESFFWWLLHASQLTHPRVRVLYRLNGRDRAPERDLALPGYRGSRPVRIGNAASTQVQLDVYGHLLQTAWLFVESGGRLGRDVASRLSSTADLVCAIWPDEDAGIWEVRGRSRHFTQSKMMCWVALDRACRLAARGLLPAGNEAEWRDQRAAIRDFVSDRCWSPEHDSYMRYPKATETDASILVPILMGYGDGEEEQRLRGTVRHIRAELGSGSLLHRYRGDDGLPGDEGAFLACSFWLVDALARLGQTEEAVDLMDDLVGLANDVGLYAEEIDPRDGAFLGNLPQGLVHLALVNAALTLERVSG